MDSEEIDDVIDGDGETGETGGSGEAPAVESIAPGVEDRPISDSIKSIVEHLDKLEHKVKRIEEALILMGVFRG